jgi:UDP-N-acetylmuramoyl-tripeptide--D-alanyl-D-alanine ligase
MSQNSVSSSAASIAGEQRPTLWTIRELCETLGKIFEGDEATLTSMTGISINTRTLEQGDIYIALQGRNLDGHNFVNEAFDLGASLAIVSQDGDYKGPTIRVTDTMQAMVDLGQTARTRTAAKSIAITGSVGKTGTKEFLRAAYESVGRTYASASSHNNHWGVPLSLSNMHTDTDFGIFEIGMNAADEIAPLTKQARPDITIITSIAAVHIEAFDDGLDGIAKEKAAIMAGLPKEGGITILPRDNEYFDALQNYAREYGVEKILSFGEHENADAKLISCLVAANGSRVKAEILGEEVEYTLGIAGKHIAINSLSALLAVAVSGGDVHAAAKAMGKVQPVKGRGQREQIETSQKDNPITLIDESWNASPVAMRAAFKVLAMIDPGRGGKRIAVLGDMRELGDRGPQMHKELAVPLQADGIDLVYTAGPLMKNLHDELPQDMRGRHTKDSAEMAEIVPDVLTPGDVVMVKGSLGSKMNIVVEALREMKV